MRSIIIDRRFVQRNLLEVVQTAFRLPRREALNALRQRQIAEETVKLLILARDLKSQMDKLGEQPMPALLLREAEVIEILARDVQAKMTLTVGPG